MRAQALPSPPAPEPRSGLSMSRRSAGRRSRRRATPRSRRAAASGPHRRPPSSLRRGRAACSRAGGTRAGRPRSSHPGSRPNRSPHRPASLELRRRSSHRLRCAWAGYRSARRSGWTCGCASSSAATSSRTSSARRSSSSWRCRVARRDSPRSVRCRSTRSARAASSDGACT